MAISAIGHINPRLRKLLWIAFLVLTSVILAYPVNLRLESYAVWSPDIFPNLPLFGFLFFLWAACLIVLLLTADEERGRWERLAVIVIAALVFRGYWNIIAPMQLEATYHTTTASIWQDAGHIISGPGVGYQDWPATSLLGAVIPLITGMETFPSITVLMLIVVTVIAAGTYVFLLQIFKSSLSASLASLLILLGNLTMIVFFKPGPIAITFLVLFLAILFSKAAKGIPSHIIVILLLLVGAVMTHLHTSVHFFFIMLGVWAFTLLRRRPDKPVLKWTVLMWFFIIPAVWMMYWGTANFKTVSEWTWTSFRDMMFAPERLTTIFTVGQANFGESAPLWYRTTRMVWLLLVYVAGGVLWLWNLLKIRRLGLTTSMLCGAFLGLGLLSVITILASPKGSAQLLRGLTYAPFFAVPLLLLFIQRFGQSTTKTALVILACILFVISFPTFLTNNSRINSDMSHPIEFSAGEWLQSQYGTGQGLNIFGTASTFQPIQFYLNNATYTAEPQTHEFKSWTEESLWEAMDELYERFDQSSERSTSAFFIHSPKESLQRSMSFNVPYDHPQWASLTRRLSDGSNKFYTNGSIEMYSRGKNFVQVR